MSAEAKSSAGIIGALPIIVAVLVYLTSPDYILLLFQTHDRQHRARVLRAMDVHGHHGHAQDDQLRLLRLQPVLDAFTDNPQLIVALCAALAVFSAIVVLAWPYLARDELGIAHAADFERARAHPRARTRQAGGAEEAGLAARRAEEVLQGHRRPLQPD